MMEDIYADRLAIKGTTVAGIDSLALLLGLEIDAVGLPPTEGYTTRVLMTNEHAKQLYLILGKMLKERERVTGKSIELTEQFYRNAGIAPEDF